MSNPPSPSDGYIKYDCQLIQEKMTIPLELFEPLNYWRNILWDKGLIGAYPDGIGFGNISVRIPGTEQFCISGTATGSLPKLDSSHYALVEQCDPSRNSLSCRGQIRASAESMSHFAIYNSLPDAQAVVHIHNRPLWEKYLGVLPTTSPEVEYGTPAMAAEITRILSLPETLQKKVIIMGGHEEGIIAFGKTVEEAAMIVLALQEDAA
jgi:ribulose-5-phosphate 4-epimerase/fuculose-1-phosphate aldolase